MKELSIRLVLVGCLSFIRSEGIIDSKLVADSIIDRPVKSQNANISPKAINGSEQLVEKPAELENSFASIGYGNTKNHSEETEEKANELNHEITSNLSIDNIESDKDNNGNSQNGQNFVPSGIYTSGQQNLGGFGQGQSTGGSFVQGQSTGGSFGAGQNTGGSFVQGQSTGGAFVAGQSQASQFIPSLPQQQISNFMPPLFGSQQPQIGPVQSYPQTTFPNPMTFPMQNQSPSQPPITFPVAPQTSAPIPMQPNPIPIQPNTIQMQPSPPTQMQPSPPLQLQPNPVQIQPNPIQMQANPPIQMQPNSPIQMQQSPNQMPQSPPIQTQQNPSIQMQPNPIHLQQNPVQMQPNPSIQMQPNPPFQMQASTPQILPPSPQIIVQPPPQQPQILVQPPQSPILVQTPQQSQPSQQIVIQQPQPQILVQQPQPQQQQQQTISYPFIQPIPQQSFVPYPVYQQQPQLISYPSLQQPYYPQPEMTNLYPHSNQTSYYPQPDYNSFYPQPRYNIFYPHSYLFSDSSQIACYKTNSCSNVEDKGPATNQEVANMAKERGCFRNGDRTQPCFPAYRCPPCWSLDIRDQAYQCFDYVPGTANICPIGIDIHYRPLPIVQTIPYPLPLPANPQWGSSDLLGSIPIASPQITLPQIAIPQITSYSVCYINGDPKLSCTGSMCPPCWDYNQSIKGYSCRDFMSSSLRCNPEDGPRTSINNFYNMQYGHINYYRQTTCYAGGVLSHPCRGTRCPSCWKINFITKRASCYNHVNNGGFYNCPIWDGVIDLVKLGFFPGPNSPNVQNELSNGNNLQSIEGYPALNNIQSPEGYPSNQIPISGYPSQTNNSTAGINYYPGSSSINFSPNSASMYYPNSGDTSFALDPAITTNSNPIPLFNSGSSLQLNRNINDTLVASNTKNTTTSKSRISPPHRHRSRFGLRNHVRVLS